MSPTESPVGVFTVCGSITTWGYLNPSYCEYELDAQTLLPVNRKTFYFDIEEANQTGKIEWKQATDWLSDYNLADLSP